MTPKTVTFGEGPASLTVSPISYGAMGLTAFYGERTPDEEALRVLRRAYDLGVRHFDTAQMYVRQLDDGTVLYNEELMGKFLKTLSEEERKDVTVATKFFPPSTRDKTKKWNKEEYFQMTNKSLERLGVDSIDLYYFHRIIPESETKVTEWMSAAKELVDQGKVKRIGLSEAPVDIIRKAHAIHPITCIQQEWSLFARDLEEELVPVCKELNIGIISYSPIGRGILAGSFSSDKKSPKDWRAQIPYLTEENIHKNLEVVERLKEFAKKKNATVSQVCLAWVVRMGGVPIPGTSKVIHLEDNMGALKVVDKLTDEDLKTLGDLGNQVTGMRGNDGYMSTTFHAHRL